MRDRRLPQQEHPRSRSVLLLAAALTMAGCGPEEVPQPFERWPIMMTMIPAPVHQFAWLSPRHPKRLVMQHYEPVTTDGAITAICHCPDLSDEWAVTSLVAFHEGGAECVDTLSAEQRPMEVPPQLPVVRSAETLWLYSGLGVLVLLTGGTTDTVAAAEAEPPPWLSDGEVRLGWIEDGTLFLGEPELEAGSNPYRVRVGYLAGELNVLVFVYTRAPFDDVIRRRPWIYRVVEDDGGLPHLDPRWRGTSFSHPFRDATLCDLTGEEEGEIAALEVDRDGGRLLTAYRFEGFGLEGLAPSVKLPDVEDRLEAADWAGEREQELVVRCPDGRFLFYRLDAEAGELRQVLSVDGPRDVLGWVVTDQHGGEPGDIVCVLPDGQTWSADSWQFGPRRRQ
ncbi:MAG: hypothetical protein ACP5KN_17215 [Armatimonadota bacterium]